MRDWLFPCMKRLKKKHQVAGEAIKSKKRLMLSLIKEHIPDDTLAEEILLLVDKQEEY